jgi:hypothetical protein
VHHRGRPPAAQPWRGGPHPQPPPPVTDEVSRIAAHLDPHSCTVTRPCPFSRRLSPVLPQLAAAGPGPAQRRAQVVLY